MCQVGMSAPCWLGKGKAEIIDADLENKEDGLCVCARAICIVNRRHCVVEVIPQGPDSPYAQYSDRPDGVVSAEVLRLITYR